MAALAFVLLMAWACKVTWDDVHGKLRDHREQAAASRPQPTPLRRRAAAAKHDAGWIAREILTGLPVTRAAFGSSWLAHRAQAEQHRLRGQHAKITFANAQAARRDLARQQHPATVSAQTIETGGTGQKPAPANGTGAPGSRPRHLSPVPDPPEPPDDGPDGVIVGRPDARPMPNVDVAHQQARQISAATGQPVTVTGGDPTNGKPVPVLGTYNGGQWTPAPPGTTTAQPNGRNSNAMPSGPATATATEFPYAQTVAIANQAANLAESHQAEMGKLPVTPMVDSLSGSGLDAETLGHAADMHDAWRQAQESQKRLLDCATAFRGAVERHAQVADAHQSAPGGGAEKGFYVES